MSWVSLSSPLLGSYLHRNPDFQMCDKIFFYTHWIAWERKLIKGGRQPMILYHHLPRTISYHLYKLSVSAQQMAQSLADENNEHLLSTRGMESRCCLARWSWLSIFPKVAVKVLARAAVISRLEWGRIGFQTHSLGGWQASEYLLPNSFRWLLAGLSSLLQGPLPRAASQHGSHLP